LHRASPTREAFWFNGTVSLFVSSGVSEVTPFRSAVPVGKLDLTTGPSQLVGPLRSDRTICVMGSTRRRTNTGSATAIGCEVVPADVFDAK
jgi:hypothetical protein